MFVGVGMLSAVAVGCGLAGWWALMSVVIASLLAAVAACFVHRAQSTVELISTDSIVNSAWMLPIKRLFIAADILVNVVVVSLSAQIFGRYVVPGHDELAAMALIGLLTIAVSAGLRFSSAIRLGIMGLLIAGALIFVTVGLAVSPANTVHPTSEAGLGGIMGSIAVFFPFFLLGYLAMSRSESSGKAVRILRILVGTVLAVGVVAVSLYQRDAVGLGLSATPLRDVLAAADASVLEPWLVVVVVVATFTAAIFAFRQAITRLKVLSTKENAKSSRVQPVLFLGILAAAFVFLTSHFLAPHMGSLALLWLAAGLAILESLAGAALVLATALASQDENQGEQNPGD